MDPATQVMDGSSFETLEAMANAILVKIMEYKEEEWKGVEPWQMTIEVGKPIAVPYAASPWIQLRRKTDGEDEARERDA